MNTLRMYSAAEIGELVTLLGAGGTMPDAEIDGMEKLVRLLRELETLSDADIEAEVRRVWRTL